MSKDRCIGFFFLLVFVVLWFYIIPIYTRGAEEAAYPRFAALVMLVPAIGMILRRATPENALRLPAFDLQAFLRSAYARIILLAISYVAYLKCVETFGFYTASFVFCIGWMFFFGERIAKRILLTPLVLLVCTYAIVTKFLKFPLPSGLLF